MACSHARPAHAQTGEHLCGLLQTLQRFAVQDLSNFYLDIAKDRLYVRALDSTDRRSALPWSMAFVWQAFHHSR